MGSILALIVMAVIGGSSILLVVAFYGVIIKIIMYIFGDR